MDELSQVRPPSVFVSTVVVHDGRVLLVQEEKPDVRGLWNIPGGRLERHESVQEGARREVREETGVVVELAGLLGVYAAPGWVRFVFLAAAQSSDAAAGDEVLAVRWATLDEIRVMPDEHLTFARSFRAIMRDLASDRSYPLKVLVEPAELREDGS